MLIKWDEKVLDYSKVFRKAIEEGDGSIELEKGVYHIKKEGADKAYYCISNNDPFEKSIAFHLKGKQGFTVQGNGATLLFDDMITAFGISESSQVTLKDLTIDYVGNKHLELGIGKVENNRVRIYKRDGFDFDIIDGKIFYNGKQIVRSLVMQFDEKLKKPLYRRFYRFFDFTAKEKKGFHIPTSLYCENGEYYLENALLNEFVEGAVLLLHLAPRQEQSVFITHSKDVTIENVNIAYSPSMGIVAQLTENVTLKNVCVDRNGKHGMLSSNCDATHFVQCSGKIKIDGCRFFNMLDDGFNCHGNYTVVQSVTENRIVTKLMHRQQECVNIYLAGDAVKVYKAKTIDEVCEFKVQESKLIANDLIEIIADCTEGIQAGDTLYAYERMPEVEITNTATGNNRPRGILITTPKKAYVGGCTFSNCEHGIECAGDTSYWFESGGCKDITIENCLFDNCNYNDGFYPILFRPVFDKDGQNKFYHQNAVIRNNRFRSFTGGMVWARNVENLAVYDNVIEHSDVYPYASAPQGMISAEGVAFGKVENNYYDRQLKKDLYPIWKGNSVLEETVCFVGESDTARLLYTPTGNVKVTDYACKIVYQEGVDYAIEGNQIRRLGTEIPYYKEEEFYLLEPDCIAVKVDSKKLSFMDGKERWFKFGNIENRAILVSYDCENKTDLFAQSKIAESCPKFLRKLKENRPAVLLFYGDSITEGADASAKCKKEPFKDMWPILVYNYLKQKFATDSLQYVNTAVGGMDNTWGMNNFNERVIAYQPDLLVLAFGMNDGTKTPEHFGKNTEEMIKSFYSSCPNAEIILVATSLPNPESNWWHNQIDFLPILQELSQKYGAYLCDMTSVTEKLYCQGGLKRYRDFTGNNVNHPNDFGERLYAQIFLTSLLGDGYSDNE